MSSHSGAPSQWRTSVAPHTARLALATYSLGGLLAVYRLLAASSASFARPELCTTLLTSAVGGLTWFAHRTNRARGTRLGGLTLLPAAAAHALLTPSTGPMDQLAAACVGLLAGAAASGAIMTAGYTPPSQTGDHEPATEPITRPNRARRRWISAIQWIGAALLGLQIWRSMPGDELSVDWTWLTLSIGVWSSHLGHRDRIIRRGPAWARAGAIVGALLLPIPSSQLLAAQLSGQSLPAELIILATLALALLLISGCRRLSTPANERTDRDTTSLASQTLAHDPRFYPHAGIYNQPWFF